MYFPMRSTCLGTLESVVACGRLQEQAEAPDGAIEGRRPHAVVRGTSGQVQIASPSNQPQSNPVRPRPGRRLPSNGLER